MAVRYSIAEKAAFGVEREFYVHKGTRPVYGTPIVEISGGVPRCRSCSGPLTAMLASCSHAKAVKRFLISEHKAK